MPSKQKNNSFCHQLIRLLRQIEAWYYDVRSVLMFYSFLNMTDQREVVFRNKCSCYFLGRKPFYSRKTDIVGGIWQYMKKGCPSGYNSEERNVMSETKATRKPLFLERTKNYFLAFFDVDFCSIGASSFSGVAKNLVATITMRLCLPLSSLHSSGLK